MKKIRYGKITILILGCWLLFSIVGYMGKDSIYSRYTINVKKTPYFVLVLQGIHDGVYPWSSEKQSLWERWEQLAEKEPNENPGESVAATEEIVKQDETETVTATETLVPEEVEPPIREFHEVDDSYFSDAVFIGDSRTVGLHDYGGLDDSTFYATVGMNIYDLWTEKFCEVDGQKETLEDALRARTYGKIYFQIGINEMGRGTVDGFMKAYEESVAKFKELQPDAVIFVQAIMKVTKDKSDKDPIFNNPGIEERNARIAELADNRTVFYLDVNEVVCDENGALRKDITFDNIHLLGSKYDIWVDYLKKKGI